LLRRPWRGSADKVDAGKPAETRDGGHARGGVLVVIRALLPATALPAGGEAERRRVTADETTGKAEDRDGGFGRSPAAKTKRMRIEIQADRGEAK
jgi:hypothetical protein